MIDALSKSIPHGTAVDPAAVRSLRWNVLEEDLHLPLLVLRESALAQNLRSMAEWCGARGLLHAPHGKTTMCPRIFARQLEAGAWGITAATVSQAEVCARSGVRRVLIANQVVGRAAIRSLAGLMAEFADLDCYTVVDSCEVVSGLSEGLAAHNAPRPVGVLVEWGRPDWRTGVHSLGEVRRTAAEVLRSRHLRLRGVEAFEGLAHTAGEAATFLAGLREAAAVAGELLPGEQLLASAGGSAYLRQVSRFAASLPPGCRAVVRSGCYVTHDHGEYMQSHEAARGSGDPADLPALAPALELWSYVQSCPRPGLAVLTFGKRDCPYDAGLPVPLFAIGRGTAMRRALAGTVVRTNDQHAFLEYEGADALHVGDRVCCGISHPCTAFDKWRTIPVVDDAYNVIDLYSTYF